MYYAYSAIRQGWLYSATLGDRQGWMFAVNPAHAYGFHDIEELRAVATAQGLAACQYDIYRMDRA
ncbi:MAG: hypothetical protein ACR652_18540 [Methylocystis sp.]|uniref:hypothetical protein n=1 Tax=Methylocystis sp. TaxID=1911079 RepID=UPI003DA3C41D